MTTVRSITPIYLAGVPGPELARPLQQGIEELNGAEREIILHLFSMNSIMMLTSLWQVLDELPNGHKIKNQIKGIVFDSCPSYTKLLADANVVVQSKAPEEPVGLQLLRRTIVLPYLAKDRFITYMRSFWDPKIYERTSLFYRLLSFTDIPKNQLYLYSKADHLCNSETIDQFREIQAKRGNNVDYVRWEDSPHVAHGRKYPEQYQNALRKFCRNALTNFDEASKHEQTISKL